MSFVFKSRIPKIKLEEAICTKIAPESTGCFVVGSEWNVFGHIKNDDIFL